MTSHFFRRLQQPEEEDDLEDIETQIEAIRSGSEEGRQRRNWRGKLWVSAPPVFHFG